MVPREARVKNMTYWQAEEAKEWKKVRKSGSNEKRPGIGAGAGGSDTTNNRRKDIDGNQAGSAEEMWEGEREEVGS